jgi:hypothetical protein
MGIATDPTETIATAFLSLLAMLLAMQTSFNQA